MSGVKEAEAALVNALKREPMEATSIAVASNSYTKSLMSLFLRNRGYCSQSAAVPGTRVHFQSLHRPSLLWSAEIRNLMHRPVFPSFAGV